jgi:hypothetical protein
VPRWDSRTPAYRERDAAPAARLSGSERGTAHGTARGQGAKPGHFRSAQAQAHRTESAAMACSRGSQPAYGDDRCDWVRRLRSTRRRDSRERIEAASQARTRATASVSRKPVGCVIPVLVREPADFQAKTASGTPPLRGARLESFSTGLSTRKRRGEARASPIDEDREGRTRLVSRALRSAAEEPDQLVPLALGQSGDRL